MPRRLVAPAGDRAERKAQAKQYARTFGKIMPAMPVVVAQTIIAQV